MSTKELTNFDLYVLNQRKKTQETSDDKVHSDYNDYIIRELRRTQPSDKKVLTEDEYNELKKNDRNDRKKPSRIKNSANIKKFGLLALILYVMIIMTLALIVLMSTNRVDPIPGADASDTEEGTIQVMPSEEAENASEDWFDRFCDSLNK